jgi:hypothetical protein
MAAMIDHTTLGAFLSIALALFLPLIVVVYYVLRLRLRRNTLMAKIFELHLEPDYIRVFHFKEWEKIADRSKDNIRSQFSSLFNTKFQGDNSFRHFMLPLAAIAITMAAFASIFYDILIMNATYAFVEGKVLFYAVVGAMLYVYPLYITAYASFSLNPPAMLDLVGRFWLSTVIGLITASVVTPSLQSAAALLGGLLPLAGMEFIRKKVFDDKPDADGERLSAMLELLHGDRNLLTQLEYIGVRSVLELAYENPLRLFVETDLNLVVCIDLVDQANLRLYVPDKKIRTNLNRHGIRTAIDIMTQLYEELPIRGSKQGKKEWRFLEPDEPLPNHLVAPLTSMAGILELEKVEALRNIMQMMIDNPQLKYVFELWGMLGEHVDHSTVH